MGDDGRLIASKVNRSTLQGPGNPVLQWQSARLGGTSAQVIRSETDVATAFVSCGPHFLRVCCSASNPVILDIESVWLTNRANPAYMQAPVSAMYQLPYLGDMESIGRNLGGFLFTVAGDHLLFSQLDSDVRYTSRDMSSGAHHKSGAVPRKILTKAKPTNILYLASLRRMIVATMEARDAALRTSTSGSMRSSVKLMKLYDDHSQEDTEVKQEDGYRLEDALIVAHYNLEDDERVYSIVQWSLVIEKGKKYNFVIVGTGRTTGSEKGRRLIFNTGRSGTKLQLQKESSYDAPVYCIAVWSNEATVSVAGKTLSFDHFDAAKGRWFKQGTKELPSAGVHISVSCPFVYISTQHHSVICYEVVSSADSTTFQQTFTDVRERSSTHSLVLDVSTQNTTPVSSTDSNAAKSTGDTRIVLTTDKKTASLVGLFHPPTKRMKHATESVFEATLPRTVIRLSRGAIRPPWRRPQLPSANTQDKVSGILQDDIIGACSDGTIYSFSILSEQACVFLRMLQTIIEKKAEKHPANQLTPLPLEHRVVAGTGMAIADILMNGAEGPQDGIDTLISARSVDPAHQTRGPGAASKRHVDGDLILRWMEDGGDVRDLVSKGCEEGVEKVVREYAGAVLGDTDVNETEVLERVKAWLGIILEPVL